MRRIRATHQLTQTQIAEYLLINRIQVAQYESRERLLPTKALIKMSRLEVALDKNDGALTTTAELKMKELQVEEAALLEKALTPLQISWFAVGKKLKQARAKYKKTMEVLRAIPVLLQQLSPGKEGEFEKKWLQATEFTLLMGMKNYGPAKQKVLELRQAVLEKQINGLQALIKNFTKTGSAKKKKVMEDSAAG